MRKILWVFGAVFLALLVAVVSIPLFVNVDQYRPVIEAQANQRMNGKLSLGTLRLSLWGAIKIHAASIRVAVPSFEQPLLDTQRFHLEIPYLSILRGKPQVVAVLESPRVDLLKQADGRANFLELLKAPPASADAANTGTPTSATDSVVQASAAPEKKVDAKKTGAASAPPAPVASAPSAHPAAAQAPSTTQTPTQVPALLANATLGLRIEKGDVTYRDLAGKSEYRVQGLDLDARNLGLGSSMDVSLRAPLKGSLPGIKFEGPVTAVAAITPVLVNGAVKAARGSIDLDATGLALDMPGTFVKPAGMNLTLKTRLDGDERETLIRSLELQLHDFRVHSKGLATTQPLQARLELVSDPIRLDKLKDVSPLVAPYGLRGSLNFQANVDLTADAVKTQGDLKLADGSVTYKEYFREPLGLQAQVSFTEASLNLARLSVTGPGSDLQLTGTVKNFLAPQFALTLSGKSLDLDRLLVDPATPAAASAPATAEKSAASVSDWIVARAVAAPPAKKPAPVKMSPIFELSKKPVLAKASGFLNAQLGRVVVKQAVLEQVNAKTQLQSLTYRIQEASLRTFGGLVKASGDFDLGTPGLVYRNKGAVAGISAKDAFRTYFPKYANTLEGDANADWSVSGALYPDTARLRTLKGGAKLLVRDGVVKSVDIQQTINQAMAKVPFLKDKKPFTVDDGFRTLTADVKFDNGVTRVEPIEMQPRNRGFVVKGSSVIQESLEQETHLDVYDPQGILPRDIQQPGKPALALRLTGPLTAPRTDYEYTVKKLAANAGTNAAKNVGGKLLDKILGDKKEEGGKDPLRDAADKLRKKFKF